MAHTDHPIRIPQRSPQKLIRQDPRRVAEPKQAMIRHDRPHAHHRRMHHALVRHRAQARMAVDEVDVFSEEDVPEVRKKGHEVWEGCGGGEDG
jgi:hypothetical protein